MKTEITVYHLEMTDPSQARLKPLDNSENQLIRQRIPCPEWNRFFYTAIGGDWHWIDRLPWTYEDWTQYLKRNQLQTWVLFHQGQPAGYAELEWQPGRTVEIAYFGLLPQFIGKGLGSPFLSQIIKTAWDSQIQRLWVHTCSLDHPRALKNYLSKGFTLFKTETLYKNLPDSLPGPWPGAEKPSP